jgi:ActR/RegA family two-component response regulator
MTLLARENSEVLQRIARDLVVPLETIKKAHIERAMILCEGNAADAARRLGLSYNGLRKLLNRYRRGDA